MIKLEDKYGDFLEVCPIDDVLSLDVMIGEVWLAPDQVRQLRDYLSEYLEEIEDGEE